MTDEFCATGDHDWVYDNGRGGEQWCRMCTAKQKVEVHLAGTRWLLRDMLSFLENDIVLGRHKDLIPRIRAALGDEE